MPTSRIVLAGALGGIAMFAWMSVAHLVLPLGAAGISQITNNEPALLADMHNTIGQEPGLYMFPSFGSTADHSAAAMQVYEQKLATNPSGLLIYHPPGAKAMTPGQLITEFLLELIEALLAVFLLARTRLGSYAARVGFVTVVGILAALPTNLSYWNWYGFPTTYTAAYMTSQILGFVAAGLVAAAMLRQRVAEPVAV
ncbi:MAG TPA: hypothetical protein VN893_09915 [Bryobacteraceae bacterium]|nr:hypothetical protein [Bryobacteraceae bacterium]